MTTLTQVGIPLWDGVRVSFNTCCWNVLFTPTQVSWQGCSHLLTPCSHWPLRSQHLPWASSLLSHLHSALRLARPPPPWCGYWHQLWSLLPPEWRITPELLWKTTQKFQLAQCGAVHLPKGTGLSVPGTPALLGGPGYLIISQWHSRCRPECPHWKSLPWSSSPPFSNIATAGCWSAKNGPRQGVKTGLGIFGGISFWFDKANFSVFWDTVKMPSVKVGFRHTESFGGSGYWNTAFEISKKK